MLCWWCELFAPPSLGYALAAQSNGCVSDSALSRLPACRLCERQTRSGGLNGRPEKLQDVSTSAHRLLCFPQKSCHTAAHSSSSMLRLQVCYSWWCLSSLSILGRLHWIDQKALTAFILNCQVGGTFAAAQPALGCPQAVQVFCCSGRGQRRHLGSARGHGRCLPHVLWHCRIGIDGIRGAGER